MKITHHCIKTPLVVYKIYNSLENDRCVRKYLYSGNLLWKKYSLSQLFKCFAWLEVVAEWIYLWYKPQEHINLLKDIKDSVFALQNFVHSFFMSTCLRLDCKNLSWLLHKMTQWSKINASATLLILYNEREIFQVICAARVWVLAPGKWRHGTEPISGFTHPTGNRVQMSIKFLPILKVYQLIKTNLIWTLNLHQCDKSNH